VFAMLGMLFLLAARSKRTRNARAAPLHRTVAFLLLCYTLNHGFPLTTNPCSKPSSNVSGFI